MAVDRRPSTAWATPAALRCACRTAPTWAAKRLIAARDQLLAKANASPIIAYAMMENLEDAPQLRLDIDRRKAQAQGVVQRHQQALSTAYGSAVINEFPNAGRLQRVVVQADAQARARPRTSCACTCPTPAGSSLAQAALQAARLRFRPIVMTSLAFILGVVPLALASGAGASAGRHRLRRDRRHAVGHAAGGGLRSRLLRLGAVPVPAQGAGRHRLPAGPGNLHRVSAMSMHFFPRALCALAPAWCWPAAPRPGPPASAGAHSTQWPQQDAAPVLSSSAATLDWNSFIADRQLRQLVDLARPTTDLRQTLLNVEAARALYQVQRADRLPGVGLQGGGTRQRLPGDMNATGQPQVRAAGRPAGVAAFELDLFGRVRNLSKPPWAMPGHRRGRARRRISLGAEVVQAYLSRDGALRRLQLAQRTLRKAAQRRRGAQRTRAAPGRQRPAAADGRGGSGAVLVRRVVPTVPAIRCTPAAAGPVGRHAFRCSSTAPTSRRPSTGCARSADIGAARAAFFPRISLTGFLGSSSADLSDLFRSGQRAWSFTPQVTLPLFDGGRNRANLDLAVLRKDMAVAAYEQAIQTAFREVADALAATDTLRREEGARLALRDSSRESLRLAQARYQAGWTTICATWTHSATPSPTKAPTHRYRDPAAVGTGPAVPRAGRQLDCAAAATTAVPACGGLPAALSTEQP
ncbi:Tyrosine-protein kinase transmembrane receptor ROR2 [Manis javanica]|nr:Tyrosine-protein kinase transmembrane receptor ROR2 [Manis javanica]